MGTTTKTITPAARSWEFSGSSYVRVNQNSVFDLPQDGWAIAGWVFMDSNAGSGFQTLLEWNDGGSGMLFAITIPEDSVFIQAGNVRVDIDTGGFGGGTTLTGTAPFNGNPGWRHITVEYLSGDYRARIYVDGVEQWYETYMQAPVSVYCTDYVNFGRREEGDTNYINSGNKMSHWCKITGRVFTADERAQLSGTGAYAGSPVPPDEVATLSLAWYFTGVGYDDELPGTLTVSQSGMALADDVPTNLVTVGDYTTLAAWSAARGGSGDDEYAICYGGGDLGGVEFGAPWASQNAFIEPADGESPYIATQVNNGGVNGQGNGEFLRVTGIEFKDMSNGVSPGNSYTFWAFDRCTFHGLSNGLNLIAGSSPHFISFANCLFYDIGIDVFHCVSGAYVSLWFYNNTAYDVTGAFLDWQIFSDIPVLYAQNNISSAIGSNCYSFSGSPPASITAGYNMDDGDGTAQSVLGGSGNLSEATPANIFTDAPGGDFTLFDGSVGQDVGNNIYSTPVGYFNEYIRHDILERSRPRGAGYCMGCYETLVPADGSAEDLPEWGEASGLGLSL